MGTALWKALQKAYGVKVLIMAVFTVAICVAFLKHQGFLLEAIEVLLVTVFLIAAVNFPSRWRSARGVSVFLVNITLIIINFQAQETHLESTLVAALAASFLAVRISPNTGLVTFTVSLLVSVVSLLRDTQIGNPLMEVTVLGVSVILTLQIVEVSQKFHLYRRLSIYDDLTNLHNMRYFRHKLKGYFSDPKVKTICLLLLDLDHFKRINDEFGHREGDVVLQRTARLVERVAQPNTVIRYGGEEFVILLTNTELETACVLAERIRLTVQNTVLTSVPMTLSCGIAQLTSDCTPDDLFDAADKALYAAKEKRNCIRVFSEALVDSCVVATNK